MAVAIAVPMTFMLVTGIVFVVYFYLRSKEKQMMIEKDMSYEQMMEFMKSKRSPYTLLKVGIVTIFFGLGLGLGFLFENTMYDEDMMALAIFTMLGAGMVVAYFVGRIMEKKDNV